MPNFSAVRGKRNAIAERYCNLEQERQITARRPHSNSQYGRFSYGAACSESPPYPVDSPICVIYEVGRDLRARRVRISVLPKGLTKHDRHERHNDGFGNFYCMERFCRK